MMRMRISHQRERDYEAERAELNESRLRRVEECQQDIQAILEDQQMSPGEKSQELKVQKAMLLEDEKQFQEALTELNTEEARMREEESETSQDISFEAGEESDVSQDISREAGEEVYCSFADEEIGSESAGQGTESLYCSFADESEPEDQQAGNQQDSEYCY